MRMTPDKHLYSREHVLADDLSKMMSEPKKFAAYLGIAKLYYESDLRALARYVLEKPDLPLDARGKYFFGALKGLTKIPGAKLKRGKQRRKPASAKASAGDGKQYGKRTANRKKSA